MATSKTYVPDTFWEAAAELTLTLSQSVRSISREQFVRSWSALAYLHPGLHPDHFDERDSGWLTDLLPMAAEAWRRAGANELSDEELYPSDAQWCGLFDRMFDHTTEESERRLKLSNRPRINRGDIVRYKDPYPDEFNDLMVITEWNVDRGFGKHLNTGLNFPPVTLLRLEDIEVVDKVDV